jgi:hypothetical protein
LSWFYPKAGGVTISISHKCIFNWLIINQTIKESEHGNKILLLIDMNGGNVNAKAPVTFHSLFATPKISSVNYTHDQIYLSTDVNLKYVTYLTAAKNSHTLEIEIHSYHLHVSIKLKNIKDARAMNFYHLRRLDCKCGAKQFLYLPAEAQNLFQRHRKKSKSSGRTMLHRVSCVSHNFRRKRTHYANANKY